MSKEVQRRSQAYDQANRFFIDTLHPITFDKVCRSLSLKCMEAIPGEDGFRYLIRTLKDLLPNTVFGSACEKSVLSMTTRRIHTKV